MTSFPWGSKEEQPRRPCGRTYKSRNSLLHCLIPLCHRKVISCQESDFSIPDRALVQHVALLRPQEFCSKFKSRGVSSRHTNRRHLFSRTEYRSGFIYAKGNLEILKPH